MEDKPQEKEEMDILEAQLALIEEELKTRKKGWVYECKECHKSCPGYYASGNHYWAVGDWVFCPMCNQLGWKATFDNLPPPEEEAEADLSWIDDQIQLSEQKPTYRYSPSVRFSPLMMPMPPVALPAGARVTSVDTESRSFNYSVPDPNPLIINFAESNPPPLTIITAGDIPIIHCKHRHHRAEEN